MPLILNGSTGISGTDGSAGTPAVQGTDTNTGMFFPAADQIAFAEGGVEAMRLDASGNVGIGTSSPAAKLHVVGNTTARLDGTFALDVRPGASDFSSMTWKSTNGATTYANIGPEAVGSGSLWINGATNIYLATGGTERARVTSGGQFLIGTTNATQGFVNINGFVNYTIPTIFSGATGNLGWSTGFTPQPVLTSLYTSNSVVGNNVYSASDVRLKDNVQTLPAGSGLEFVAAADPVSFTWKTDGTTDTGFIAQALLAKGYGHLVSAIPDGAMEELQHEDGNVSPAGFRFVARYDSIVPLLTAALKEQQAQIEELKARVAALEATP